MARMLRPSYWVTHSPAGVLYEKNTVATQERTYVVDVDDLFLRQWARSRAIRSRPRQ